MSVQAPTPGKALAEQVYQFVQWIVPIVERLPRAHKFTIGDRIATRAMSLLECVVESVYTRDRAPMLRRAQLDVEQLRYLFRLCADLHLLNERAYEHAARTLDRIGREVGGWRKAHNVQASRSPVRADRELQRAAPSSAQGNPR